MNNEAFEFFRKNFAVGEWASVRLPRSWAGSVCVDDSIIQQLPSKAPTIRTLLNYVSDRSVAIEPCVVAILAWGAMQVGNGQKLWQKVAPRTGDFSEQFFDICLRTRAGEFSRTQAFDHFARLRSVGGSPGCGPAYFTKLIYFLHPEHNGYIMDQWTSLGVNLIGDEKGENFISVRKWGAWDAGRAGARGFVVSDKNTSKDYERFCLAIEEYSEILGCMPDNIEQALFSQGGHNPLPWRTYVREHFGIIQDN